MLSCFVRWPRSGVWGRIMDVLAAADDASIQMIDTSIARVHQRGACTGSNRRQWMGRLRGGLTSNIHALVDSSGYRRIATRYDKLAANYLALNQLASVRPRLAATNESTP